MTDQEYHEDLLYRNGSPDIGDSYRILRSLYKDKVEGKLRNRNNAFDQFKKEHHDSWKVGSCIDEINGISGIFPDQQKLRKQIQSLVPGSFGIWTKFKLETPYFSKDDESIYVVDNPVLKERNWKIPMIRGSAWKGAFLNAAVTKLKNTLEEKNDMETFFRLYHQIYRIFGTGTHEFRAVEQMLNKVSEQANNSSRILDALLHYALFELGVNLRIRKEGARTVAEQLLERILKEIERFGSHRGRAIFYPTYFDRCSLEILNPHEFTRRKGKNPIFFEVVPKDTVGIFQLIYVPYDGILMSDDKLKREVAEDEIFLNELLAEIGMNGIGAKKKMWGRFKVEGEER